MRRGGGGGQKTMKNRRVRKDKNASIRFMKACNRCSWGV
jgi:hypothetical protein